jgi:HEAT repeat-containing protein 5
LQFYQSSWLHLVDAIASLIDEDSEFVFDALDGKTELSTTNGANGTDSPGINYRDEPVAFFFVLFGLAFEALVGRSGDSQAGREHTLEILQALKKILRPSVSGQAIYQEAVFSETMDMLDRLVLTEALNVQSVIVEIARNLCLGHPSARKSANAPVEEEKLSEDIDQLFELTRIIVLVLAGLVPNLTEDRSRVRHDLNDEAVALLSLSLSALVDASAVFPSVIKTDLHACIIHIFATILGTPSCQTVVVPQALPIFKRFLTSILPAGQPIQPETKGQLRASLTRFLAILKHSQNREFETAVQCEKNVLLASTILLSTADNAFAPDDPLLQRFVMELADCLESRLPTKMAASCARSLVLLHKRCPTDEAISASLIPHLLSFIVNPSDTKDLDESRSLISHALTSFVLTFTNAPSQDKVTAAMALVMPALLSRASTEGKDVYKETATRLLELAAGAQAAFRSVVTGLSAEQRAFLEAVIKEGAGRKETVRMEETAEPSIELKMDFQKFQGYGTV